MQIMEDTERWSDLDLSIRYFRALLFDFATRILASAYTNLYPYPALDSKPRLPYHKLAK